MPENIKSGRHEAITCPHCGMGLDAYTGTDSQSDVPVAGSVSICIYCTNVSKYTADMKLEAFAAEDFEKLKQEDEELYWKIDDIRIQLRAFNQIRKKDANT